MSESYANGDDPGTGESFFDAVRDRAIASVPARYRLSDTGTALRWDLRPIEDPDVRVSFYLGPIAIPRVVLLRVDFSLRLALIALLPTAVITYNATTTVAFAAPSLTVLCAAIAPKLRLGTTMVALIAYMTAVALHQSFGYIIMAIDPGQHWALFIAVYVVTTLLVAATTEGGVTKLVLFFFNVQMVSNWTGNYGGFGKYQFVGWIAISVLVGMVFALMVPLLPFPRTCRHDAEERLHALYTNLSTAFAGTALSLWVFGPHQAVQRRIAANRLRGLRRLVDRLFDEAFEASKGMLTELHSTAVLDRLALRLKVASDLAAALDGMLDVLYTVSKDPLPLDESRIAQRWGRFMLPTFVLAAEYADTFCRKAGSLEYVFTQSDIDSIVWLRERARVDMQEVRRLIFISDDGRGAAAALPAEAIAYFSYNFGRFVRTLSSFHVEDTSLNPHRASALLQNEAVGSPRRDDDLDEFAEDNEPYNYNSNLSMEPPPTERFEVPSPTAAINAARVAEPLELEPTEEAVGLQTSFAGRATASFIPPNVDKSFRYVLPPTAPAFSLAPTEPLTQRILFAWPRGLIASLAMVKAATQGDPGTLLKLREAAKLTFAQTTAMGFIIGLGIPMPVNGAAVIAFVKDSNAGLTILASTEYIASTIMGSVYGFIGASLATSQALLILALCVIGFFSGLPRLSPKYAHFAELVAFFAVLGVAPGFASPVRLLQTVETNVAMSTWLVVTHTILWPVWPSTVLVADLRNAIEQLRVMLVGIFAAIAEVNGDVAGNIADGVQESRAALKATTQALRKHIASSAQEPSLRPSAFPEREFHRVVDAIERVLSLVYPVAAAVAFLRHDLCPIVSGEHVPAQVILAISPGTLAASLDVDALLRTLYESIGAATPITVVEQTLIDLHAQISVKLADAHRDALGVYSPNILRTLGARSYEMPATLTILRFINVLPDYINTLVETVLDAQRQRYCS